MNKHHLLIITVFTLSILLVQPAHSLHLYPISTPMPSTLIHVDIHNNQGPWFGTEDHPFQSIKEGVLAADYGDTILIADGIYREHGIVIEKAIHIQGQHQDQTIIDMDYHSVGFLILSDHVSITQVTMRNSSGFKGDCAVYIQADTIMVSSCTMKRTRSGIIIEDSKHVNISKVTGFLNGESILVKDSEQIILDGCEFCHNSIGANIQQSKNVQILHCQAHENGVGMLLNASEHVQFFTTGFYDNNDNQGGCFITNSKDFSFSHCTIQHNGFGSRIKNSTDIHYDHCLIQYNTHFGFYVNEESDISIKRSNIINNLRYGIYLYECSSEVSESNIIDNSIDGVHLTDAVCDAGDNYWGHRSGPYVFQVRLVDRMKSNAGTLSVYPWRDQLVNDAGSNFAIEETFTKTRVHGYEDAPLDFSHVDSDGDGVPDWWEERYEYDPMVAEDHRHLDPDGDAITNTYECYAYDIGADPYRKDVFLEFDWMPGLEPGIENRPPDDILSEIIQRFEEHDITLHIDVGLGNGSEIPLVDQFTFDVLRDLYWDHFLNNDLRNPRKNIFHYGLICNTGPGNGFAFVGLGQLNAFCISANVLQENNVRGDRGHLISSGSMHELGHNLGLFVDDHGGNDNTAATRPWYREFYEYWNYKSIMNYRYTYAILNYSDGQNGFNDYNDWGNLQFDFFLNTAFDLPDRFR